MLSNILLEGKTRSVPIKPRLVPVFPSPSILNDRQGREEGEEASLIEWTKDRGGKREGKTLTFKRRDGEEADAAAAESDRHVSCRNEKKAAALPR